MINDQAQYQIWYILVLRFKSYRLLDFHFINKVSRQDIINPKLNFFTFPDHNNNRGGELVAHGFLERRYNGDHGHVDYMTLRGSR